MKHLIHGLLAIGLISSVMAQDPAPAAPAGKETDVVVPPAEQAPELLRRVEVITLAVSNNLVVKQLMADGGVTAEKLVKHWKDGEAELLEMLTVSAGSRTAGKAENTAMRYLYKGVRYSGAGGNEVPDYEQRTVGSKLQAKITAQSEAQFEVLKVGVPPVPPGANAGNARVLRVDTTEASLDITANYVFSTEVGKQTYPSVATINFSGKATLYFGQYTLIGGGYQSPDKQTLLFLLAKLGKEF